MIKTRFSEQLYDDYKKASIKHGLEMSEIANRAIRKFRNSGLDVATLENVDMATKKTQPITIRLQTEINKEEFFKILNWYLSLYEDVPPPAPLDIAEEQAMLNRDNENLRRLSIQLMNY